VDADAIIDHGGGFVIGEEQSPERGKIDLRVAEELTVTAVDVLAGAQSVRTPG